MSQNLVSKPEARLSGPKVEQLNALTGLRFIGALSVVVCHTAGMVLHNPIDSNIAFSHAVSFFFVLSGFILTFVHPQINGMSEAVAFWRARFGRIYPAHLFSLALVCCFASNEHFQANFWQLISNIFLVHAWVPHYSFMQCYNLPAWSVSDELFFYLLFPVLIAGFAKNWPVKLALAFGLACAVIAIPAVTTLSRTGLNGLTVFGLYYFFPPSRLFEFVIGMCCALLWKKFKSKKSSLGTAPATLLEFATIALFIGFASTELVILRPLLQSPNLFWQGLGTWLTLIGNCIPFAALILVFAFEKGLVSKVVATKPLVYLGELSYATYLLHYPVILFVLDVKAKYHSSPIVCVLMIAGLLLAGSMFSFHCVEKPLRKLIVGKKKVKIAVAPAVADESKVLTRVG